MLRLTSLRVTSPFTARRSRGFSLVEVLVGVAIGLAGLLVIFRTVATWNAHTRSTTSGGDAQSAGTLAIFQLERDIRQAGMGFGLAPSTIMGCTVTGQDVSGGSALSFRLFPVQIVQGAAGAPDQLNVLYGDSSFYTSLESFTASTDISKKTKHRNGFKPGDVMIAADGTNCRLMQVTGDANADGLTLDHAPGTFTSYYSPAASAAPARYNPAGSPGVTFTQGNLFNLGPNPQLNNWQIGGAGAQALIRTEILHTAAALEVSEGVVNMKAQYGIDANNDDRISSTEWTNTAPTDWTKVRAVRVGILVRSRQFEKTADQSASAAAAVAVTPNPPAWAGGAFVMRNVDGTADSFGPTVPDPNNWRFYRYRVYEKEIPLRNMIWGTSAAGAAP